MELKKPQVIIIAKYKRCSTSSQTETSIPAQDEILEKEIQRMREDNNNITYKVLDFSDEGLSGKDITNRPKLQRLLVLCEKKEINIVLFTKLDRLGRSLQDLLNTVTIFNNNDVSFKVVEQHIDTLTPTGKLMFHIFGAFAEFERNMIRERMVAGRERAKIKGTKSGKPMHRPKSQVDEDGVVLKFKNGMSMNQISKAYGVSITPVRRILMDRGEWKASKRNENPYVKNNGDIENE